MVFPSVEFALFFPVVLVLSWALMPRPAAWKPFILAASYLFYAAADPRFCLLLAGITLAQQLGVAALGRARSERRRNWIVGIAVALDLGVLGLFKYYGFFVEQVNSTLELGGLGMPLPLMSLALPVGLSFIVFQAVSYIVDVRRGICEPASTTDVAIYLSFFPHLVAGPIVRAKEFLPQLASPRDPADVAVGAGVVLIVAGLVKKVVFADQLARSVVDPVFAVPEAYAAPDVALALVAYAMQIYCDFSGYTDIAIGLALLMGFVFPQNFNRPYRALSFSDFWRRWHMTLSRFLRDFVYIPLGGNRKGRRRTTVNLMTTMLLGGLWHGAAWGFVVWGAVHGFALVTEHALRRRGLSAPTVLRWGIVFAVVVLAWVPFRARTLELAGTVLERLTVAGPATLWSASVVAIIAVVLGSQLLPERPLDRMRLWVERRDPVALGFGLAFSVMLIAATVPGGAVPPFIYFQF